MLGNSKQIAELQERVASLEAELATANGDKTRLNAEIEAAKAEHAKALTEAGQKATKLEADLAAANARAEKAVAEIDAKVTERLAAAGVDPVKRDPKAAEGNDGKQTTQGLTGRARIAAAWANLKK